MNIEQLEESIREKVISNRLSYTETREMLWIPAVKDMLTRMATDETVLNTIVASIDHNISNNVSYERTNFLMELLVYSLSTTDDKLFQYERYIAAANIYDPLNFKLPLPTKEGISRIVLDTVVNSDEEQQIVKRALSIIYNTNPTIGAQGLSVVHILNGLRSANSTMMASKSIPPLAPDKLINALSKIINKSLEYDMTKSIDYNFDLACKVGEFQLVVIHAGHNLIPKNALATYDITKTGKITEHGNMPLTADILDESMVLTMFPIDGKIPDYKEPYTVYSSGDRCFVVIDYAWDRYLLVGRNEEDAWNPIFKSNPLIVLDEKLESPKPLEGSHQLPINDVTYIMQHKNFISLPLTERKMVLMTDPVFKGVFLDTFGPKPDMNDLYTKVRDFMQKTLKPSGTALERAKINSNIHLFAEAVIGDVSRDVEVFSPSSFSLIAGLALNPVVESPSVVKGGAKSIITHGVNIKGGTRYTTNEVLYNALQREGISSRNYSIYDYLFDCKNGDATLPLNAVVIVDSSEPIIAMDGSIVSADQLKELYPNCQI